MKRIITLLLTALFALSSLVCTTLAAEMKETSIIKTELSDDGIERLWYADGGRLEIITEVFRDLTASNSITGYRTYQKKDSSGTLEWKATLTATFTYTGTTSSCTGASCAVTIYKSNWYVVSNITTRSANTATTHLTMGYKVLGTTLYTRSYTITLSCDANGNLS